MSPAVQDVKISMTGTGVISGRISDAQGQPAANVAVRAMKTSFTQGRESLQEVLATITNDLGEYRLFFLAPGKYYVGATPGGLGIGGGTGTDNLREFRAQRENTRTESVRTDNVNVAIYFPGTADSLRATPIEVKAGVEVRNIDFIAAPIKAHHIRGVISTNEPGQRVAGDAELRLFSASTGRFTSSTAPNFDLSGVLPGKYIVAAKIGTMSGRVAVEVFDQDLSNVQVVISNAVSISGRVIVEGTSADNPGPDVKTLRVVLRSEPTDGTNINPPLPAADGSFSLEMVPPGPYRVSLSPPMQNGYVKSVQLDDSEGIHTGITVRGPAQLRIIVSARPGTVQGRVLNDRNEPIPNSTIVLVPDTDLRSRTDLFRNATTNASGEFRLSGLTPGKYKLFAWEEVESGAWLNSRFLNDYEERGTTVVVTEGSAEKIDLKAISN